MQGGKQGSHDLGRGLAQSPQALCCIDAEDKAKVIMAIVQGGNQRCHGVGRGLAQLPQAFCCIATDIGIAIVQGGDES